MRAYPSSLTDEEWEIIRPILPDAPTGLRGRPREHSRRDLLNGIFYILRTGGARHFMPNDLTHWKTCYHYFRLWAILGDCSEHDGNSTFFPSRGINRRPLKHSFQLAPRYNQFEDLVDEVFGIQIS